MTVGMMADRSLVIGLTREYRPNWSFSMILCRDFDRPQWVRIAKVALHYTYITNRDLSRAATVTFLFLELLCLSLSDPQ